MHERATFARRWRDAVSLAGDRPFLTFEAADGAVTSWTYTQFDALVQRVAEGLAERGAGPGRGVHLVLQNSPAFVAAWLAGVQLGACVVPSDPQSTARELAEHIRRTGPAVGVCATARVGVYREAAVAGPEVVEVDESDTELTPLHPRRGGRVDLAAPQPRTPAAVMFTSGTTAAPKGVVVTQANYAFAGEVMAAAAGVGAGDRLLVVLPLFHANAQYYSFAPAIATGASVALMHRFSAGGFLEQAARHAVTHASLFAAPMRMILARGATPVAGLRLRHVWYAQNVGADQYETLATLFGCRPRQLYGMTETIPAVLSNRALDPRPDSMGVPTLGCHVELRRFEDGGPVADGEVGEVVVGGVPGITLFDGYLDDPQTTARSFRDGMFRTGDRARRDADGHLHFAGRGADVLKVAGENVSVVEIEAVLAAHPAVFEAAVVGRPDPVRDEVPVAFVVLAQGHSVTAEELQRWCEERLARSKRPHAVEFVPELPRTSVGKIRKFLLGRADASADLAVGR